MQGIYKIIARSYKIEIGTHGLKHTSKANWLRIFCFQIDARKSHLEPNTLPKVLIPYPSQNAAQFCQDIWIFSLTYPHDQISVFFGKW